MGDSSEEHDRNSSTPDDKKHEDKKKRKETLARLGTAFLGHAAESLMVRVLFVYASISQSSSLVLIAVKTAANRSASKKHDAGSTLSPRTEKRDTLSQIQERAFEPAAVENKARRSLYVSVECRPRPRCSSAAASGRN
jgi:hypothetical protein